MTYNKNDPETIRAMFNSIAKNYDRTNAVLSFQMHKRWNAALVKQVLLAEKPKTILDLCCGTGAIAFDYLRRSQNPLTAYMLDFSEEMLAQARIHADSMQLARHEINYLQADAQHIPLANSSIECATIAYGIRNVKQPQRCLEEVFRVLKSNGTFGILELTQPSNFFMKIGHSFYLKAMLPILGKLLTSNQEAYQYLCNSIPTFIPPQDLENLMQAAGFRQIKRQSLFGGVATLLIGKK